MTSIILQRALGQGWTQRALCVQGSVCLNKFVPENWIEDGTLPPWRQRVLKSAGWELFEYNDERYLMPDPELASFALGVAYQAYRKVVEGRGETVAAGPSRYAGAYNDLIDCILHNDALKGQMPFASGATLLYPLSFDTISPRENISRRVRLALQGGWAMVNPITEGRDLFLLPPEAIIKGNKVTPDDARVSRGVLQRLHKTGLIALRARGFGKGRIAPAVFSLPPRSARGQTWGNFVADQMARWRNATVTPVVDFTKYSWLADLPELAAFLQKHHPYVEHFDLMRIEHYLSAWRRTADFDVLEKMIGGVKGIMGEIAARREIVDEYQSSGGAGSVLVVAPQIMSGGDVLERSDAMVVGIDGETAVIEKMWEVITADEDAAIAEAEAQHRASAQAYRKGGVVFRDAGGRVFRCRTAVLPKAAIETYAAVIRGNDKDIDAVLDALRERLVVMMEMDLVDSRVRSRFAPMREELQEILRDPQGVERLMGLLGAHASADGRIYVRGRVQSSGQVISLQIIGAEEAGNIGSHYFRLGFDFVEGKYVLREARGGGALDLALSLVESHSGRTLEMAEKRFIAGILGTQLKSRDAEERLMVEDMAEYLREHTIEHLLDLMRFFGVEIPNGRIYLTGRSKRGGQVIGLRVISAEEASKIGNGSFLLGFDSPDEGYVLREIRGTGALDLALPWVESRLGRRLDTAEKAFFAGSLGTRLQSRDADERLTVEDLAGYLREQGIERLLDLMRCVGASAPDGRLYMAGQVKGDRQVIGLKIVDEKEVGQLDKSCFLIGFDFEEGGYALREAQRNGALDLALPWVESRLGRRLDTAEKAFFAGVLGTRLRTHDEDERLTVEDLAGYLREQGIERLLDLARLAGVEIPDGRIHVRGHVESSGQVTGLRIIGAEEVSKIGRLNFLLGFDPMDEGYVLREARGARAMDLTLPLVESHSGRPMEIAEKSFVASVLGTQIHSRDKDERLKVEDLAEHLREHGIEHLLELMLLVGAEMPKGRLYVTGSVRHSGQVIGLRIIGAEEASKIGRTNFLLGFDPKDGAFHLDRESIHAHSALKKALISQPLTRYTFDIDSDGEGHRVLYPNDITG